MSIVTDFFRVVPRKRRLKLARTRRGLLFKNATRFEKWLFGLGTAAVLAGVGLVVYIGYPVAQSLVSYHNPGEKQVEKEKVEQKVVDKTFRLKIPKIMAYADVKKGVSPFDKTEYLPILSEDIVAHAKNSGLPGQAAGRSIYLFAHSTEQGVAMARRNAVFYLLGELDRGDNIYIDFEGQRYVYRVYENKVVSAKDIEYLKYHEGQKEVLILQTCWPIGTDWRRLLVFAELVETSNDL